MMRIWLALPLLCAASAIAPVATAAAAEDPFWQRGRDGRFEVAFVGIAIGSTLEFLCSAYQVPNTAIITLRNVILGAQLEDGQNCASWSTAANSTCPASPGTANSWSPRPTPISNSGCRNCSPR
jgi:hypothetical protein